MIARFKPTLVLLVVLSIVPASLAGTGNAADAPAVGESWPMFRGDGQADGVARGSLPEQPVVLWKTSFKDAMFEATAAIVDGVVYIGGQDGPFRALDLRTGQQKWQFDCELGFKAPAAVRDGRVYVGDSDGTFYCLDARDGKKLWSVATDAEINAGANFFDTAVLIGSQDGTLYALDAQSGEEHWKYTIDNMIQCSPTLIERRAFIAGCDGKLHVLELTPAPAGGGKTSIAGKREVDIQDPTGATPAAHGSFVYFGTQGSRFYGVDWKQGKIAWTFEPKRKQPFQSSAAVAEGMVIVGGRDRLIHGLDAETGVEVWSAAARARIDSSPVVVGERVFIGADDGRLYAFEIKTGKKVWEYEAGGHFPASPAVAAGRMVIANDDGDVYCFGAK